MRFILFLAVFLVSAANSAETIVSDLSQNSVSITANFEGSEIFIFGAVKRDSPPQDGAGELDVVIEISGPPSELTVHRKDHRFGIWINSKAVTVDRAPSFYSIASTAPLVEILSERERAGRNLGLNFAVRAAAENETFRQAVIRIKQDQGSYATDETPVNLTEDTLFTTKVALPANLIEGDYTAKIYLIRGGQIISSSTSVIEVRKAGLERWLYNLAHEKPLIYGLMSLLVALIAGYSASEIFRLLRR